MGHKRSYQEIKEDGKTHFRGLAERLPDPGASERFRTPAYQAGRLIREQANLHGVRWIDLIDYMLQHVMDGSIRLSDPILPEDIRRIDDGHIDVIDYLANKYNIIGRSR